MVVKKKKVGSEASAVTLDQILERYYSNSTRNDGVAKNKTLQLLRVNTLYLSDNYIKEDECHLYVLLLKNPIVRFINFT